ncbi:MAG: hypothetical protein ACLP9S_01570 [Syntrophales bacterium]|jgi:hypothetical protein
MPKDEEISKRGGERKKDEVTGKSYEETLVVNNNFFSKQLARMPQIKNNKIKEDKNHDI